MLLHSFLLPTNNLRHQLEPYGNFLDNFFLVYRIANQENSEYFNEK